MQKITPFLWFNNNAEEAMDFYLSVFKNSDQGRINRFGEAGPGPEGTAMSVSFRLEGLEFFAMNGGPLYQFTPAISMFVDCRDQGEIDYYWERLSEGGSKGRCG